MADTTKQVRKTVRTTEPKASDKPNDSKTIRDAGPTFPMTDGEPQVNVENPHRPATPGS